MKQEIAILGFGREGKAVFKFLKNRDPKLKIGVLDQKFDKNYLHNLEKFKLIFRSPGVPYNLPEIQRAIKKGVLFSGATDLFFKNAKGRIIGVTGTKGKGTTSTLIYKILKNAHKDVHLVGNIGKPAIDILPRLKKNSWTVFELSSFQLQDLKVSPNYAVVLDIFPDHMDAHKNFKEYLDAKSQIARHQKKSDKVFYFKDSKTSKYVAGKSKAKKIPISIPSSNFRQRRTSAPAHLWVEWWNKVRGSLKIPGSHNWKNTVMAAVVTSQLGIPEKVITRTIKTYRGLPYRIQLVRSWRSRKIYNDSASTNPQTTAAAINSFTEPKTLIVGGYDKNLDYKLVRNTLKNSNTKLVILFGENRNKIYRTIKGVVKTKFAKDLTSAFKLSLKNSKKGDVILFSPGAASFDMFKDYKDRGKKFNQIVKSLKD